MNALWQIILQILWRLRPVSALEMNLHDIIALGFQIFTSDEELDDLAHNPARRATIAPTLADAHAKLNLLIYLRACELAGLSPRSTRFIPNFTCTNASTDTLALWRAFQRLVAKFDDYERLAKLRAQTLRRDASIPSYGDDQRLSATHHDVQTIATAIAPLLAQSLAPQASTQSTAITLALARLHTRGPPLIALDCPLPTADCLAGFACEIAPSRPKTKRPPSRAARTTPWTQQPLVMQRV